MNRNTLLALIAVGLILLFVGVWLSLQIFPHFSLSIMLIVIIVFIYVLTENWITHAANEFENRFWSLVAFFLTFICVFVDDSPFNLGTNNPQLGWFLVILICFLAHNYDRHLRREKLKRVSTLKRVSSSSILHHPHRDKLRKSLDEIDDLLPGIDNVWFSSTFLNFFLLPRVLYVERNIISIFQEASPEELNYLVTNSHLGLLFYKMKDHNIWRVYNRTILLDTLAIHRIAELTVLAKACLLDGLQRMKISAHEKGEIYVKNILLRTSMDDLSDLKSTTDSKGDFYSLHKLIYEDIKDNKIRNSILEHISKQARTQRAHMHLGTSNTSKRRSQYAWRKILSDVDDTLSCSGGSYPAGLDTSYPKKALYPGVLAFYRELDLGCSGPDIWNPDRVGNLVFLSARPHVYKDALEAHSYELFKRLRRDRGLYSSPSLLAGSLVTGGEFMVAGDMEPLAQQKFANFQQYAALYMEYDFVFVGDNGQGDVRVAELVSMDKKLFSNLERVYVHEVQPLHLTHACNPQTILTRKCPFTCYFTTYVDAAIDAYEHKLIRLSGLRRIAEEAVFDFERIPWDLFGGKTQSTELLQTRKHSNSKTTTSQRERKRHVTSQLQVQLKESFRKRYMRLLELNHSLVAANAILVSQGLEPVQLLRFQCLYPRGTPVNTLMGYGVVEKFRYHDGIYEVRLALGLKDDGSGGDMAYLRSDSLAKANRPRSRFMGFFTSRASASQENKLLSKSSANFKGPWIAWTPYGMAKLVNERTDNIVILTTTWGATLYLNTSKVVKMKEVIELPVSSPLSLASSLSLHSQTSLVTAVTQKTQIDSKRRGFWSRLFGIAPTPQVKPIKTSESSLEQTISPTECALSLLPDNVLVLSSLFEHLERFLETTVATAETKTEGKEEQAWISPEGEGVFCHSEKWIEVVTSYGKGRLIDLLVRSEFMVAKVILDWGGLGYLALSTIQSFEVKRSFSGMQISRCSPHLVSSSDSSANANECLQNVRKIRGSFQDLAHTEKG